MVGLVDHGYMVPVGPPYGSDCATVMIFTVRENCASAAKDHGTTFHRHTMIFILKWGTEVSHPPGRSIV